MKWTVLLKKLNHLRLPGLYVDKTQEFFPERNYNRAIKAPTGYFGDKFGILPESIKELFLHITSAADAAAKPTEQHIELESKAYSIFQILKKQIRIALARQ